MPVPIRIHELMSRPVVTASRDTTLSEAATRCYENDIGSLVVVDDGAVVGIVTGDDMIQMLGEVSDPGERLLHSLMSSPVVTTTPDASVTEAVERMREHDIARLVVVEDDEPVGLVSSDDILRYVPQVFHRQELDESKEVTRSSRVQSDTVYEQSDWEFESVGLADDHLNVGDRVEFTKSISEQDVRAFAAASGDTNRLHLDEGYAEQTRFGRRIAHGTLVSGIISAALARLPGLTIYLSQDLSFHAPVDIGDRVTATCEIVGTFGEDKYELTTDVHAGDELVVEGEATVLIDEAIETDRTEAEAVA
ncbi:CBS domain-containing protein [Halobacteriaceae archaeon SHR40]|uniref:CBS domain-containing protein n=1 Tax=Halovenus amylolytica TaxID=2500550 RepID=UPI000FE2C8CC